MLFKKTKRIIMTALVLCLVAASCLLPVQAADTDGYCYNKYNESVPAPESYRADKILYGTELPAGFGMADDMFSYQDKLYVLNQKAGSIMIFDQELNALGTLPIYENGQELPLIDAAGMFFWDNEGVTELYIADTTGKRVLVADAAGNVNMVIKKPDSELFPQEQEFVPTKVLVGADGTIYVICRGIYKGAATFSHSGEFLGFYGSNNIEVTAAVLLEYWWKSMMNETQVSRLQNSVPIEYTNFCIDVQGFIYTCTKVTDNSTGELKRMNAKSLNVLPAVSYGDLEEAWLKSTHLDTAFVDVAMMNDEILCALDTQRGRVFLYDKEGHLLTIFGNTGNFVGNFRTPSAVECIGNYIYVLDPYKDCLVRFTPTVYGKKLLSATSLYQNGRYEEALADWNEVLQMNGNYETAYVGIGKALMGAEQYEESMEYFRLGEDRTSYSQAYEQVRKGQTAKMVVPTIILAVVLFILISIYSYFFKSKPVELDLKNCHITKCFAQTLFHPVEGFMNIFQRVGTGVATMVANICVALAFFTAIVVRQATGFIFNPNQIDKLNIWIILAAVLGIYIAFVVSNRLVCTLFNGNGSVAEIRLVTAYALVPAILAFLIRTVLSSYLIQDEGVFLTLIAAVGIIWSACVLLSGMCVIHEYSFAQAVLSVVFTFVGMIIIAFIALLVVALYQQLGAFIESILNEISYMNR